MPCRGDGCPGLVSRGLCSSAMSRWDGGGGVPHGRVAPVEGSPVRCAVGLPGLVEVLVFRGGGPGANNGSVRTAGNAECVDRYGGVGGRGPDPTLVSGVGPAEFATSAVCWRGV